MDKVRQWMWTLKDGEKIADRQGDVAFIPKTRMVGTRQSGPYIEVGNHRVYANEIRQTKHKVFVRNPHALHGEHKEVKLEGIFEVRMARQWELGFGD